MARAQAQAGLSSLDRREGRLVVPEATDQGTRPAQVWVFSGGRQLEAPNAPAELSAAARALARGPERAKIVGEQTRLYALPVVENGTRFGTVVAAVSLDPYEDTERTAFVGALILAGLLLGAVTLLSRWMLGRALEPVSRMTADAAAWSASDLDAASTSASRTTSSRALLRPSTPCWSRSPRASDTSSDSPPSFRTSSARRSRGSAARRS